MVDALWGWSWIDWALLAMALLSIGVGAWRGLLYEVLSVFAWIAAWWAAQAFGPTLADDLPMGNAATPLRMAAAYTLVFVGVAFAGGILAWLVQRLAAAVGLRPIDRVLGAVFGGLRAGIVLLALCVVVGLTPWADHPMWRTSWVAAGATEVLNTLRPLMPHELTRLLP
jgi:membrane protein required for colicin V production